MVLWKGDRLTNLNLFDQYTIDVLDKQGQVDAMYTDFAKTFDKVDHGVL